MKKFLVFMMVLLCFSNLITDVNASSMDINIISKENWNQDYYEYNGLRLTYRSSTINNFWYTGREYIYRDMDEEGYWRYRKSDDMVEWEVIPQTSGLTELSRFPTYTYSINYWGDKYIVFNRLHESSGESISEVQHNTTINRPLLIFDGNFELISKQEFEYPITAVSYVDGKYYAETKDYSQYKIPYDFEPVKKVYVSEDGIDWNEDKTLSEAPIGSGKNKSLILVGELPDDDTRYTKKIMCVAEQADISDTSEVVFEKEQLRFYKLVDDIYISWGLGTEETNFQISLDGIYWLDINYPDLLTSHDVRPGTVSNKIVESVCDCIAMKDKILFQTQYRLFEYNLDDLRSVFQSLNIYYQI